MNANKTIKDLKERNEKLSNQAMFAEARAFHSNYTLNNYRKTIDEAIKKLQLIYDIAFDYDGYNDVEHLKSLIDEIVEYSIEAKKILKGEENEYSKKNTCDCSKSNENKK